MFNLEAFSTGETVPPVEPADLGATLKLMMEFEKSQREEGVQRAIGMNVYRTACSPGANIGAVWFRAANLHLALSRGEFTEFMREGELAGPFLSLWAMFPFKAVNIQQDGSFQLNGAEFAEALRNLNSQ